MHDIAFTAQLDIFSSQTKQHLRNCGKSEALSSLGPEEYFCFTLYIHNNSTQPYTWSSAYVCVDGGQPLRWPQGQVKPASRGVLLISRKKMIDCATPGGHDVVWYLDGKPVHREHFHLSTEMKWEQVFPIPSRARIAASCNPYRSRSPYIFGWLEIPNNTRYTEYSVEFKADHLPAGTYCCLGNWTMDDSGWRRQYRQIRTWASGVNAYAGFQRLADGSTSGIMSFWDLECTDSRGNTVKRSATRLYPSQVLGGGRFGGEGEGERSNVPFSWRANRWYRMHLKCIPASNATIVEQWVQDLQTGASTLLTRFSFPIPNSSMQGNIAVFLENFLPETAGEIRSMEVRNAKYLSTSGRWHRVKNVCLGSQGGLPAYEGSYNFGVSGGRIWMITSGAGGDWYGSRKGKQTTWFSID